MSKIKSVRFNFIMNFILTASSFMFPLITFPYVSRVLLPDGNGKIAFACSVMSYFSMFGMLGIPTYGIRECARVRDNKKELSKIVQELLIINIIITMITYGILIVSIFTVKKFEQERVLLLINSVGLILNVFGVNWLYAALEQYSYITVRSMIFKIISIILMFVLVHEKNDYIVYAAITVLAASGSNIMNFIYSRKFIDIRFIGHYNFKRHIRPIFVFFATTVAINIYTNLDTVMLGFMKGDVQVGYYNAAIKIKYILLSLVTSLSAVLLPRLSYYVKVNKMEEFKNLVTKALNFIFLLSFPLIIYFIVYAKESVIFISGDNYIDAVPTMMIIVPAILFNGLSGLLGNQVLVPLNREKDILISVIVGAGVNLILNLILIPKMGSAGTAIGTLVAELVVFVVQVIYLKEFMGEIIGKINLRYIMISCIVSTILIFLLKKIEIASVFISLIISAAVFFGTYAIVLLIQKEPLISEIALQYLQKVKLKK